MSARKLVLCVIDGLTPGALEAGLAAGSLPTLGALVERGQYLHGVSTFPSVTPVCLSSIATGAGPDAHGIPHLSWFHRGERRVVEYGSSFGAARAAGLRASLRDSVLNMSQTHLSPATTTVFEDVEDAGLVAAAVNFTCYRGRARHAARLPELVRRNRWFEHLQGPSRFFFFNLYESEEAGTPVAVRSRTAGSVDRYAAAAGRWLVTRDGFDFLVYYLPDFDYAAHAVGPASAQGALERADRCLADLTGAAGGVDRFLERYGIVVCADHGQSPVRQAVSLRAAFPDVAVLDRPRGPRPRGELAVLGSNRAAMLYRLDGCRLTARQLAERLDDEPAVDVSLFREGAVAVARRAGAELRFRPGPGGFVLEGDAGVLDPARYPDGLHRAWGSLACPNSGDVVLSAAEGHEFEDLGGRHHAGGGSHGSLLAEDSLVPVILVGVCATLPQGRMPRITDLKALALSHLGVAAAPARPEHVGAA